jgi:arginine-tRNA-protein transferase
MLREIQYGLEQGYRFFYPGYIVPGNPRFDYKLRIGTKEEVCFFDSQQAEWRPFVHFSNEKIPVYALSSQLIQIGEALASAKINSQMLYFSNFEKAFSDETRFPGAPLFLHCYADLFPKPRFIVYYDWLQQQYVFCHGLRKEEIFQYLSFDHHEAGAFVSPLMVSEKSVIIESSQMEEIVAWVRLFRELVQPPAKRTWL